jgi:hypothetical protein
MNSQRCSRWKVNWFAQVSCLDGANDGTIRTIGVCTDVGAFDHGTGVVVANCHNGLSQQWSIRPDGTLVNIESNRCMDVEAGNTADGTKIQLSDADVGSANKLVECGMKGGICVSVRCSKGLRNHRRDIVVHK